MNPTATTSSDKAPSEKQCPLPRHLLIIWPGAFTTGWLGPTARVLDIAHGLAPLGWRSSLLAGPLTGPYVDEAKSAAERFPGPVRRTPFTRYWYPSWADSPLMRKLSWWGTRLSLLRPDPEFGWGARAAGWYLTFPDFETPDMIWAVADWTLGGPVAASFLARQFQCPWVLELEDPWPVIGTHPGKRELNAFEACLDSADAVVTTTRSLARDLGKRYPGLARKLRTFYLTFDSSLPRHTLAGEPHCLRLVHIGSIYGGRRTGAECLIRAIAQVQQDGLIGDGHLRLDLIGGGPHAARLVRLAARLGIEESVIACPQLPLAQAVQEMDSADVLVVIKFADPAYQFQIPGKTFQYLGRGKPILGLMDDCEAADILRRSGLGTIARPGEVDDIARCLVHYWQHRESLAELYRPDWNYIRQFSRDQLAQELDALFAHIISSRRQPAGGPEPAPGRPPGEAAPQPEGAISRGDGMRFTP